MTYILYSSRMSGETNTTANVRKPLNCETHFWMHLFSFSHTHAQALHGAQSWGACSGGGGWCWGDSAQRRALFPLGGLSASLSLAWSFIIYGRDKIKQTQQNSVKSECCSSHIYMLSCGGKGGTGAEFVQLLVPASQHPSASRSQVETLY